MREFAGSQARVLILCEKGNTHQIEPVSCIALVAVVAVVTTVARIVGTRVSQLAWVPQCVTHPWGPLGGNLHNNVVVAAVLYFQRLGLSTVRFDFCGTQIGRGYTQVDQLKEIVEKLLNGDFAHASPTPPRSIILVGYS